ncbi:hypothetical protein M3Y94_00208100 [Aphelenchoides besseyi]|nr:hypothetical protein M3Y94_00208100 [Aphelenchoides besseyi]
MSGFDLHFLLVLIFLLSSHVFGDYNHPLRLEYDEEPSFEGKETEPQFVRHRKIRWKEQELHPQVRMNPYNAYRLQCFSCMSPYLEDQFVYISHLYRKPLSFTDRCDRQNFDWHQVQAKNCSDLCVTLRMNDKVGGRRRNGYLRGCMSDIKFYNRSILYYGDMMRTGQSSQTRCQTVRLRDLFAAPDWFGLEVNDHVELCTCATPYCNAANSSFDQFFWLIGLLSLWSTLNWSFFPTRRKPELLNAN